MFEILGAMMEWECLDPVARIHDLEYFNAKSKHDRWKIWMHPKDPPGTDSSAYKTNTKRNIKPIVRDGVRWIETIGHTLRTQQ